MSRPADDDPADGSEAAAETGGAGVSPDGPQPLATQAHHQEEEEEACHLQEQVCALREEVSHLQMENQQVKQKAHDLEEENSRVLAENQWLKEQVQVLKEQVENQQVKQKARDLEEENSHLSADITKANQQDPDHLSAENQRLKEQAQVLMEVMNHLLSEKLCLKDMEEVSSHVPVEFPGEAWQDHDQDMAPHLSAENQRLKEQVHALVGVVSHQLAENKQLRQQRQDQEGAVSHPKREVQKVRRNQAASGPEEAAKNIIPSFPPVSLRTSLDKGLQKVLLVVMHYARKDITEIPIDPKQQVPHPALVQAVHTRYTLQDGFYPCEMNQRAMADVADAIKKFAEDN